MNKRICPYCGGEIPADSTFCSICGAKIEKPNTWDAGRDMNVRRCPNCGNEIIAGDQFCAFCGARVPLNAGQSAGQQTSNGRSGGQPAAGANTQGHNGGYEYEAGGENEPISGSVRRQVKSRARSDMSMARGKYILVAFLEALGGILFGLTQLLPAMGWIVGLCYMFLLWAPFYVGCTRFFTIGHIMPGRARASEMFYSFQNGQYVHVLKVTALCEIKIILWSMLLIVPGIVKGYAWRLAPYLAAEYPDLSAQEVLDLSASMMKGRKIDTFVYDLTFFGWYLLAYVPLVGLLVGLLYVYPYKASADAGLYIWIRDRSRGTDRMNRNRTGYWNY